MSPIPAWMPVPLAALLALGLAGPASAQGTPIGFEETYALAPDREAALRELVPGTEEFYYFQCLHRQNVGALDEVGPLLESWIERHGRGQRVEEIENRQALLAFERDPGGSLTFLRRRLGLGFGHARRDLGARPDLPTRVDSQVYSTAALTRRALSAHSGSLAGFRDVALRRMASAELSDAQLMDLLRRLERPDVPNLPALVVRNLASRRSRGFGSLGIHRLLLLDQLEACAQLRPGLLDEPAFVETWLPRLRPSADVRWERDPAAREAYLERLQTFVQRLAPAHNSLKAHVLYHRLSHDLALGQPDRELFLAYLRLPRPSGHVAPEHRRRATREGELCDLSRGYPTGLTPVGDDEALVRAYLTYLFQREESFEPYAPFLRGDWLRRLFAETRILAGEGDMERWYSLLDDPGYYEQLERRVEIEFVPTQRTDFGPDEPVAVTLEVKNVPTLLVKVFEIDALEYYRAEGREVDASIDLDGLVAQQTATHAYSEGPLRRVRRTFELPSLSRPGVYVVELIGNGRSSRALIRKGRLRLAERAGAAGHVLRVLDDEGRRLDDAAVVFGGREYSADADGEILVPYSTEPGAKPVILRHGRRATLERLVHRAERYGLSARVLVDREALLAGREARLLVRPRLLLNESPVGLRLLEEPVLSITSVDLDGTTSSLEVRDLELSARGELVHSIQVPARLAELRVRLRGRVDSLTRAEPFELQSAEERFVLNGIDATIETFCPLLGRTPAGYVLDVLGKNGEARADHALRLTLTLREYTDALEVAVRTDARGRVELGDLKGVTALASSDSRTGFGAWSLRPAARTWPVRLQGNEGETLRLPLDGPAWASLREEVSLLELRAGTFARDRIEHARIQGGFLELAGLPAGDYDLWLRGRGRRVEVRVTAGEVRDGWAHGRDRALEVERGDLLQVTALEAQGEEIVVRLANAGRATRVHLVATRYVPAFDPFDRLRGPALPPPRVALLERPLSGYHSGREIGDEHRYILERRLATKFPGNMLRRPSLLLNPWALEEADTVIGLGGGAGGRFGGRGGGAGPASPGPASEAERPLETRAGAFPNLDFLPQPSLVAANLRPDADGVVRVPRAQLGSGHLLHAIALDGRSTVYASQPLAESALQPDDRRLAASLDTTLHLAQQRRIELKRAGETTVIEDVSTSSVEVYDSLASVHRLFLALTGDEALREFAFVLRWPELGDEAKRELYSSHACHELHVFLRRKDPGFFDAVVRPYLANKVRKDFLDHWLLDDDLSGYLEPWAFSRLNVVERILLTQRVADELEAGVRHVREGWELRPPDPATAERLFRAALAGKALDSDDALGRAVEQARGELRARRKAAEPAAPAEQLRAFAGVAVDQAEEGDFALGLEDDRRQRAEVDLEEAPLMDKDVAQRERVRSLYRDLEPTRRYVETDYWRLRLGQQGPGLIEVDAFWRDFAEARGRRPFLSANFPEAAGGLAEMMLALAFLDLPFEGGGHVLESEGARLSLGAASPLLLVIEAIHPAEPAEGRGPLLVSQDLFRHDDRWIVEGNERREKIASGALLRGVAYGCKVVVTNPTSAPRELELLLQIPAGSIPLQSGSPTPGRRLRLEAYGTSALEYSFYFPAAGAFAHFPVHVAESGKVVAFVEPKTVEVVPATDEVDRASWVHVSQAGTAAEVLAFVDRANLRRLDLDAVAWRLRDRGFYDALLARLRDRLVYHPTTWSYGLYHGDAGTTAEYLRRADGFLARCGRYLASPLLVIDPVERRAYEHVEYEPLVNARAHRFGGRHELLNADMARQYLDLLAILCQKPRLDAVDHMSVTYYLLLQDRVEEALAAFEQVDPEGLPARIQHDYMRAYMDFFSPDHALARGIAEGYREHPVERWRTLFGDVLTQLDEAEGRAPAVGVDSGGQGGEDLARSEPALELAVEAGRVSLDHRQLESVELGYYEMDLELLFSNSPFVQQASGAFAYVRPTHSEVRALPLDGAALSFALPAELESKNVVVVARAGGFVRRQAHYANALALQVIEGYGQLRVSEAGTGRPLPRAYVKVYSRGPSGTVRFHKDGYTDLRGRFDYVSLSARQGEAPERFAILVLSEAHGATTREAAPPTR